TNRNENPCHRFGRTQARISSITHPVNLHLAPENPVDAGGFFIPNPPHSRNLCGMNSRFAKLLFFVAALTLAFSSPVFAFSPDTTVWLDQPARNFTESCPLGNGRLGA